MADLMTEVKDRVLYLTLNRPDKLNAMSAEMMGGLVDNLCARRDQSCDRRRGGDWCRARILLGRRYRRDARAQRKRRRAARERRQTIEDRVAGLRRGEEASLMLHRCRR